jgi:integrase
LNVRIRRKPADRALPGRWYVSVVEIDPTTGKRRDRAPDGRRVSYTTKRAAQRAANEIRQKIDARSYVRRDRITVEEWLEKWQQGAAFLNLSESTRESYARYLRVHIVPRLGPVRLQDLDAPMLDRLYADLLRDGNRTTGAGLSRRTVQYIATILHSALEAAMRKNLLDRNPGRKADVPKRPKGERGSKMRTWDDGQLRHFLESSSEERLYPAFVLAATTGMRRGEVLGLERDEFHPIPGEVVVLRSLQSISQKGGATKLHFEDATKSGKDRVVGLDPETVEILRSHLAAQAEERLAIGPNYRDQGLVFAQPDGSPVHPETFRRTFLRLVKASGLPPIRLHDLRHTWATLALKAGVHPKVVQERLGHSRISITLDLYTHAIPSLDLDAAGQVARLIFGVSS